MQSKRLKAAERKPGRRWGGSQQLAPYVFVLPFILSFLAFFLYPMIQAVLMSFQEVLPGAVSFVGLEHYRKLWNADFGTALLNSTRYTFWTLLVLVPLPMVLAVFLNSKRMAATNLFRSALFIPALTSVVVAGVVFRLIFGELDGAPMNTLMNMLGLESRKWLLNSSLGMLAMVVLATWRWSGINMLYFLSALQSIPRELYEAAEMDGAGKVRQFVSVTLPMLKPISLYVITITIYGGFSMFTESYMLWAGKPSPQNIGLTMVGYIYQQGFQYFNLGFGAAVGIVLLAITLGVSLLQLKVLGMFGKEDESR